MIKRWVGLFLIALMPCVFSVAHAAVFKVGDVDYSLGGSARIDTGWIFTDYGDIPSGQSDSKRDFMLYPPSDSNIYLKAVSGQMTAYAEVGFIVSSNPAWDSEDKVYLRHLYATYDMGGGNSLLVGQTWTCMAEDSPNQKLYDDNTLMGFGDLFLSRNPQIRYIRSMDKLTFQIAIEDNKINGMDKVNSTAHIVPNYILDEYTPALAVSLGYDAGNFVLTPSLYAQQNTLKANQSNLKDIDVLAYALALDAAYKTKQFTVSGEIWWGQNVSVFAGIAPTNRAQFNDDSGPSYYYGSPILNSTGSDIEDIKSMGGWVQLMVPFTSGTLYTGLGYQKTDIKNPDTDLVHFESKAETMGAFINYEIPIVKNFTITPELTYYNYGNNPKKQNNGDGTWDSADLGTDIMVGIHFQYDF